jgi:hypothetical protein
MYLRIALPGVLLAAILSGAGCEGSPPPDAPSPDAPATAQAPTTVAEPGPPFQVSGTGVHYFSTQIVHQETPTESGMTQRSSDIVRLEGDLEGFVLYHPVAEFDFEAGTLVVTGRQFFSGTVAGSDPVLLHDDRFRFDVELETGETTGSVHFGRSADAGGDAPWFDCELTVTGTGTTPDGDAEVAYQGTCRPGTSP